jgi:diacylglycerol kinase family enzyme
VRVAIISNEGSGNACDGRLRELREAVEAARISGEIVTCEPARLTETARRLATQGYDAIVSAGGDGTASAVANALAGGSVPMGVLPCGTLNHFARDLKMPDALADALRAITEGTVQRVDVGEVNGRVFVNNSSLGLYPEMVALRDRDRKATGRGKWTAAMLAAMRVLRRFRLLAVRVEMPHRVLETVTPFVFVGNNDYSTDVGSLGERDRLDAGRLALYTVHSRGRLGMFATLIRAMLGRAEAVRDLENELVTELWVKPWRHHPHVAVDGEVVRMTAPLHYRIRPRALPVVVPTAAEQVA